MPAIDHRNVTAPLRVLAGVRPRRPSPELLDPSHKRRSSHFETVIWCLQVTSVERSESTVYAIIRYIDPTTGDHDEQQVVFEIRELPFHDDR